MSVVLVTMDNFVTLKVQLQSLFINRWKGSSDVGVAAAAKVRVSPRMRTCATPRRLLLHHLRETLPPAQRRQVAYKSHSKVAIDR